MSYLFTAKKQSVFKERYGFQYPTDLADFFGRHGSGCFLDEFHLLSPAEWMADETCPPCLVKGIHILQLDREDLDAVDGKEMSLLNEDNELIAESADNLLEREFLFLGSSSDGDVLFFMMPDGQKPEHLVLFDRVRLAVVLSPPNLDRWLMRLGKRIGIELDSDKPILTAERYQHLTKEMAWGAFGRKGHT